MSLIPSGIINSERLPLAELADFLKLRVSATGATRQESLLEVVLRSAITEIEARCGRIALERDYEYHAKGAPPYELAMSPLDDVRLLRIEDDGGNEVSLEHFALKARGNTCLIETKSALNRGQYIIHLRAGASEWAAVDAELQLAILNLAAYYYNSRQEGAEAAFPKLVQRLIEKHRIIRVS